MWFLTGFFLTVIGAALGIVFMLKEIKDNVADEMGDVCGYYKQYFEDYECNCQLE